MQDLQVDIVRTAAINVQVDASGKSLLQERTSHQETPIHLRKDSGHFV